MVRLNRTVMMFRSSESVPVPVVYTSGNGYTGVVEDLTGITAFGNVGLAMKYWNGAGSMPDRKTMSRATSCAVLLFTRRNSTYVFAVAPVVVSFVTQKLTVSASLRMPADW